MTYFSHLIHVQVLSLSHKKLCLVSLNNNYTYNFCLSSINLNTLSLCPRWVAGLAAVFYILLAPFAGCITAIKPLTDFLLRVVTFPYEVGTYIRDGKKGC